MCEKEKLYKELTGLFVIDFQLLCIWIRKLVLKEFCMVCVL